jgi:hypothetical protein
MSLRPTELHFGAGGLYDQRMILHEPFVDSKTYSAATGWEFKPEGACKGSVCVPLAPGVRDSAGPGRFDAAKLAEALQLPLVHDNAAGLWALGPEALGGRTLASAFAPELVLPDLNGEAFALSSLRGKKVLLLAWAPY